MIVTHIQKTFTIQKLWNLIFLEIQNMFQFLKFQDYFVTCKYDVMYMTLKKKL
jgi:hypothetical protein